MKATLIFLFSVLLMVLLSEIEAAPRGKDRNNLIVDDGRLLDTVDLYY